MVDALVRPAIDSAAARHALALFLRSLGRHGFAPPSRGGPYHTIWGDADPLYPAAIAPSGGAAGYHGMNVTVPGGRVLFPVERPWYLADALLDILHAARRDGAPLT